MTTQVSIQPIRFDLPDMPGPVAALRVAMTQAEARQNSHNFIANMLRVLDEAGVARETRAHLHNLAENMLLDEALDEPYAVFAAAHSCLSRELMWPGGKDRHTIDEIYGYGFAEALCASVPPDYPRPVGLSPGDGGMPAKYTGADLYDCGTFARPEFTAPDDAAGFGDPPKTGVFSGTCPSEYECKRGHAHSRAREDNTR